MFISSDKCQYIVRVTDERGVEKCLAAAQVVLGNPEVTVLCVTHARKLRDELTKDLQQAGNVEGEQ